ncbi:MAG: SLC13 family permease [Acidobacteria bacterium]|nr:SLC13 family permease [Acidobacteriota bacterium]
MELTLPAWITLIVAIAFFLSLVFELASPDILLLCALVVLVVTGVLSPEQAFTGFANPAVLAIGALFVIAMAVTRSGALTFLYPIMFPRSGKPRAAIARIGISAALISAITNNTPLVAILTPTVREWAQDHQISPSKLLMPMAFATTLGGVITLIGTSTNLLVSAMLSSSGHEPLGLWEFSYVGLPVAAAGLTYLILAGPRGLPERIEVMAQSQEVQTYHFELKISEGSALHGMTVEQAALRGLANAYLAHLHRNGTLIGPVEPETRLRSGDVLAFIGDPNLINDLLSLGGLERTIESPVPGEPTSAPLFHAVVAAHSPLDGRTLREINFRERYHGIVLGVHRRGRRIRDALGQTRLEPGDLLLVEAREAFLTAAMNSGDFYLVSPLERPATVRRDKAPIVIVTVIGMLAAVTFELISLETAAIAAALVLIGARAINSTEARRSLNVPILIMVASGIGLGKAFEISGLADWLAEIVMTVGGPFGVVGSLLAVYVVTNVLTEMLSNQASAVLVFPIAISVADSVGANPHAFAIAVAVAASAGFATPIGYQTHLMVMNPGGYRFVDYVRFGLPLNVIITIVAVPLIAWLWL